MSIVFVFGFIALIGCDSNTLYPRLEDHELVLKYPDVRGIQKNVFFFTHQYRENDGGDDTASKYNTHEVGAPFCSCSQKTLNLRSEGGNDFRSCPLLIEVRYFSIHLYEHCSFLFYTRQGCYSNEGDIVVLCAYLGQLARLRDALANEVAVIIDERDQASLDDQEGDSDEPTPGEVSIERVNVTKRVYFLCHTLND